MKHPVPGAQSAWLAYVQVDDIHAATQKAKTLGAQVMKDVTRAAAALPGDAAPLRWLIGLASRRLLRPGA
jgi:hypothetical protein